MDQPHDHLPQLLRHTARLLPMLLRPGADVDAILHDHLRSRRQLPPALRRDVVGLVHHALRLAPLIDRLRGGDGSRPRRMSDTDAMVTAAIAHVLGAAAAQHPDGAMRAEVETRLAACHAVVGPDTIAVLAAMLARGLELDAAVMQGSADDAALAARSALPQWIFTALAARHGRRGALELGLALLRPAELCVRVNTAHVGMEEALGQLAAAGLAARRSSLAPTGVVLSGHPKLTDLPLWRGGGIEVQDEGSQLVACAVAPEAGWQVLDACAGAGGKTLHLAALQGGAGAITAMDVEWNRLRALQQRARNAGLASVRTVHLRAGADAAALDATLAAAGVPAMYDAVLVDAPCSGIGTARRAPAMKLRLTPSLLRRLTTTQHAVLALAAHAVAPGGVLVYATCSLLPAENEDIVDAFLASHRDFLPDPLAPAFARCGVAAPHVPPAEWHLTLTPAEHGCDGFFMARMRRAPV